MGTHVFISYSRDDLHYVRQLAAFLIAAGINAWYDKEVVTGERWERTICDRLDTCAAVLVVMTPTAEESHWVSREITRAERKGKRLFPLLLHGEEFFRLADMQFEDLTGGRMPSPSLVATLRNLAELEQIAPLTDSDDDASEIFEFEDRAGMSTSNSLYFYVSYSPQDDEDMVQRFFGDLSREVRRMANVRGRNAVGHLGDRMSAGPTHSDLGVKELGSASCFIALVSPSYTQAEHTGREWFAFSERLRAYERRWQRVAPALFPIQWIPTHPLNPRIAEIQSPNPGQAGRLYAKVGLRQMMRLRRTRDDYLEVTFMLARRVVSVAQTHEIPSLRPFSLNRVPNVFLMSRPD